MINIKKPKVFLYGGCDLHDILQNDLLQKDFEIVNYSVDTYNVDNSNLNFNQRSFPDLGTSLISLYTKPGLIAQRVIETLSSAKSRDRIINQSIYNEIVKFPYLDYYKKYANSNDYLVINFSPELYTKVINSADKFTCLPSMDILKNPKNCLHWIYQEYFKEEFLLPFDTKESINLTNELLVDFSRDIYEIFQDRVILVKTHLSDLVISHDYKIKNVKVGIKDNVLHYRETKIATEPRDHNYAKKLTSIIMHKFMQLYRSNLELVELNEPIFLDSNHRWGYSQFHIDLNSRNKIAKLIYDNINKKRKNFSEITYE